MGSLVTRSTDPVIKIRQAVTCSIISVLKVLCIYKKLEGEKLKEENEQLKAVIVCGEKLVKNDSNLVLSAVTELSKVKFFCVI